jgi:uncharacterized protein HemY
MRLRGGGFLESETSATGILLDESFNGFYARHPNYILSNPIRNLVALSIIAVAVLIFIVWGVRRLLRRWRG